MILKQMRQDALAEDMVFGMLFQVPRREVPPDNRIAAKEVGSVSAVTSVYGSHKFGSTYQIRKMTEIIIGTDPKMLAGIRHDQIKNRFSKHHGAGGRPDPKGMVERPWPYIKAADLRRQTRIATGDDLVIFIDLIMIRTRKGNRQRIQMGLNMRHKKILKKQVVGIDKNDKDTLGVHQSRFESGQLPPIMLMPDQRELVP